MVWQREQNARSNQTQGRKPKPKDKARERETPAMVHTAIDSATARSNATDARSTDQFVDASLLLLSIFPTSLKNGPELTRTTLISPWRGSAFSFRSFRIIFPARNSTSTLVPYGPRPGVKPLGLEGSKNDIAPRHCLHYARYVCSQRSFGAAWATPKKRENARRANIVCCMVFSCPPFGSKNCSVTGKFFELRLAQC